MVSKNYEKIHTFSMKPSPAQICAYIIVILQVCIFYALIRSNINSQTSQTSALILTILFSVTLAFLLVFTFLSSFIDPSDSVMILCKNGKRNQLDGKLQDLLYCDSCDTYVTKNAKHCRDCRRCVQNFDHHCMWINNCVGSKNYVHFVFMIASTFSNFSVYLASAIIISLEKQWWQKVLGIIITIWVVMSIVFILWFLLFNLNLLHFYLTVKGYTTYQFIVARRQENRRKQLQKRNKKIQQEQKKRNKIMEAEKKKNQEEKKKQLELKKKNHQIEQTTQQNFPANKNDQKQMKTPEKIEKDNENSTNSNIKLFNKEAHQISNTILIKGKGVNAQNVVFDDTQTQKYDERLKSQTIKNWKSEVIMSEQFQNKKQDEANFSESESNDSLKMSSFFVRNKSYNFILSNKSVISPHKKLGNSAIIGEKPVISRQPIQINRNKSKSSLISHYSYESVVKFPAKQLKNSQIKK